MATYKTHLAFASIVSSSACSYLYGKGILSAQEAALCFSYGVAGGLLPDIDAENSKPLRLTFTTIALFAAFAVLLLLPDGTSLPEKGLWWVGVYLTVRYFASSVFSKITTHRGIVHSVPFAMVVSLVLTYILITIKENTPHTAWLAGVFLFGGFLLHLILDELYSVDITGGKLKRSFGTAFTLFDTNAKIAFIGLYAITFYLFTLIPGREDIAILLKGLWEAF